MNFVGRIAELKILNQKYNSEKFEFGYLYGQRRIGKTSLIQEFANKKNAIVLFASDSEDIKIRESFSRQFNSQTNSSLTGSTFSDWDFFFEAISSYFGNEKGLLVIDEYPNIVLTRDGKRKKTDFVSKLQNAIDYHFKYQKFTIILTGSNVSFMEKEIKDTKAPLYERNTFQLLLHKLEWNEALLCLNGMDDFEKAKVLALTSTYPYYLSMIDTSLSFKENVENLFYSKAAPFIDDPSKVITSAISEGGFYSAIIETIANGIHRIKGISESLKVESGKVSKYISELLDAGVLTKRSVFMSSRLTFYSINDPMLAFYYRFIRGENIELIKLGYGKVIEEKQMNAVDNFIYHNFENECIEYLSYLNKNGKLGDLYHEFQNFKVENTSLGRSVEIDIVAQSDSGLLIGECKLSKNKRTISDYYDMLEDTSIKPFSDYKNIEYYLFGMSGFEKDIKDINNPHLHLIDSSIMFKTE